MFTHYRAQGFILKKTDSGEFDRIFTVYTKDFGRIELLAKAERKIKSKLRGGLELFYLSELEFIQGKSHKTLTDAILINDFHNLRKSLSRLAIAFKISDTLDNLVKGQEPDEKLWHLIKDTFEKLNLLEIRNRASEGSEGRKEGEVIFDYLELEILYYYFLWNLLSILGYQPELYRCSVCQKKIMPEKIYFSNKNGGLICQNCFKSVESIKEADSAIVKILRLIIKKDWPLISKLKISPSHLKSLSIISKEYYSYIYNSL